jgi:hypothetical protein
MTRTPVAALLLLVLASAARAEDSVAITPELKLPVPAEWRIPPQDEYLRRLPRNDYPLIALESPDASQLLSVRIVLSVPAMTAVKLQDMLTQSGKNKYPQAVVTDSRTSRTDEHPWAEVVFQDTSSVENREIIAFVGVHQGEAILVSWHVHRDAIAAAKPAQDAQLAVLTAFIDGGDRIP